MLPNDMKCSNFEYMQSELTFEIIFKWETKEIKNTASDFASRLGDWGREEGVYFEE